MSYEKSGFTVEEYVNKLIWLEEVSMNMKSQGMGWLVWRTHFDGETFTIVVTHIAE